MNTVYLIVTESCNMSCPFCYNYFTDPNFKTPDKILDADFAAAVINKGYKSKDDYSPFDYVVFHGGEPLLYPRTILEIIDKVQGSKKYSLQTNLNYKELSKDQIEVLCKLGAYGTSYSYDRFESNEQALVNMVNNVRFLSSLNLKCTLIVTLTEMQLQRQNPWALRNFIYKELPTLDYIIFERPIYSIEEIDKDPEKYKQIYHKVDNYLCQAVDAFGETNFRTNLLSQVSDALKHKTTVYQKKCSRFTITVYPDKHIKFGCPSKENTKIIYYDEEFYQNCLLCEYFKYCKMDCECFNYVCAFPKKYFKKVSEMYLKGK